MDVKKKEIGVTRTARYYVAGVTPAVPGILWVVLHGYGQLAAEVASAYRGLLTSGAAAVFPEGLSRFYVKGYFGRVGASWMTKEGRQADILDNIGFLDAVLADVRKAWPSPPRRTAVLGFSQGGATAARWASVAGHRVDHLILWGTDFPRDITDESLAALSASTAIWYVHGDRDEFMDEALFDAQLAYLGEKGVRHTPLRYHGNHALTGEVLARVRDAVLAASS